MKANSILPIRLSFLLLFITCAYTSYAFEIVCPADVTIDCNTNIYDLSDYGNAQYKDYSGWHDAGYPSVVYDLNHCDQGHIYRTWTAYNPYAGMNESCTQVITVGTGALFNESNINWPGSHLEVTGCNPDLSPSALPPGYQHPTWTEGPCSMIGYSYSDKVFSISGACKKIVREWELINCCDFNIYTGHGIFTFYQEIDVVVTEVPDVICPADVVVPTSDCNGRYVDVPLLEIMDGPCSDILQVTNDSPYASSGGANASGFYPIGTTEVNFLANLGCSDEPQVCTVYVTVEDNTTPTPYCLYGLSLALMGSDTDGDGTNDEGMVELWASDLDQGSFDKCNAHEDLRFSFSSDPNDNSRVFTCDDVGRNDIEIWVTDEDGNQNYCNTYVRVQNNAANIENCEDSDEYSSISGTLSLHYGGSPGKVTLKAVGTSHVGTPYTVEEMEIIETVVDSFTNATGAWIYVLDVDTVYNDVEYMNYPTQSTYLTSYAGEYNFEELPHYHDYTIHVEGEDTNDSRVSKGDLVELKAYLAGAIEFTAYQKLAADIDLDGEVTQADYDLLEAYLNDPTSVELDNQWHFYSGGMDMENMEEGEECDEFCSVKDLKENTFKINLKGYRMGDITDYEVASTDKFVEEAKKTLEIAEVEECTVDITPNPFTNSFVVAVKGAEKGEAVFVLKNQSGTVLFNQVINIDANMQAVPVSINNVLLPGVYLYELRLPNEVVSGKLMKI